MSNQKTISNVGNPGKGSLANELSRELEKVKVRIAYLEDKISRVTKAAQAVADCLAPEEIDVLQAALADQTDGVPDSTGAFASVREPLDQQYQYTDLIAAAISKRRGQDTKQPDDGRGSYGVHAPLEFDAPPDDMMVLVDPSVVQDAERYRWLRENKAVQIPETKSKNGLVAWSFFTGSPILYGDTLDVAIDAAREGKP